MYIIYLSIYIYIYIYIYIMCIYIYIYISCDHLMHAPSPPIKGLGFEGFDSSRLLILRGGNSHVR